MSPTGEQFSTTCPSPHPHTEPSSWWVVRHQACVQAEKDPQLCCGNHQAMDREMLRACDKWQSILHHFWFGSQNTSTQGNWLPQATLDHQKHHTGSPHKTVPKDSPLGAKRVTLGNFHRMGLPTSKASSPPLFQPSGWVPGSTWQHLASFPRLLHHPALCWVSAQGVPLLPALRALKFCCCSMLFTVAHRNWQKMM